MARRRVRRGVSLATGSMLLSATLLSGCSSLPDYANPVAWYRGVAGSSDDAATDTAKGDYPKLGDEKRPKTLSTQDRTDLSEGLEGDRAHAKHTEDVLRREGNPTRPLVESSAARSVPSAQTAAVPTPVATPVSVAPASPTPVSGRPTPAPAPTRALSPSDDAPPPKVAPMSAASSSRSVAVDTPAPVAQPRPVPVAAVPRPTPVAAVAAKPAVDVSDAPPPPPPALVQQLAQAKSAGVAQPADRLTTTPAVVVAAAPVARPAPAPTGPESFEDSYRRRLAEWNGAPVAPAAALAPSPVSSSSYPQAAIPVALVAPSAARPSTVVLDGDQPIHLIPPSQYRVQVRSQAGGGIRSLDSFREAGSNASFEVAAVGFGEGTAALSDADRRHLADVAHLARQTGGAVRVFGRSASPRLDLDAIANQDANRQLAQQRADVIARELARLGVPVRKLYAGADTSGDQLAAADATEIYLDY